jgi:hypothetical protein
MKTRIKITVAICSLFATLTNAQFAPYPPPLIPPGGYTVGSVQAIGIGTFPALGNIQATLHVNSFYTATPGFSPEIYFAPMALLQN